MKTNRRRFLNFLIGGSLLGWISSVIYPIFSFLIPPKIPEANVNSVNAGPAGDFPANSGKIIQFGRKPVLLIKDEVGEFLAFDDSHYNKKEEAKKPTVIYDQRNITIKDSVISRSDFSELGGESKTEATPGGLKKKMKKDIENEVFTDEEKNGN